MLYFEKYVKLKIPRKRKYILNESTRLSSSYVMFYIKALCDSSIMNFMGYYNFCIRAGRIFGDLGLMGLLCETLLSC